jgi:hypothetical protein
VTRQTFVLQPAPHPSRARALEAIRSALDGYVITIAEPTRNLEQNAALWALLGDIARDVDWHGQKLSAEDWKHLFTASLQKLRVVPNLEGNGFVALGLSTSRMSKREFSDLLELANAFYAEHAPAKLEWEGVAA